MKLMSLFDGSGGFPLAASLCGIEPVYAAEVEPYPIAVTKNRFPKMKHLGDVSKVKGGEILLKPEGLRGHTAQSGTQGQEIAGDIGNGIKADDRKRNCLTAYSFDSLASNSMKSKNPFSGCRVVEVSKTLDTSTPDPSKNQGGIAIVEKIILDDQGGQQISVCTDGKSPTLRAEAHGNAPYVINKKTLVYDTRGNGDGETVPTITGDHNNRIADYTALCCEAVVYDGANITSPLNKTNPQAGDPCHTISTDSRNYIVHCLQGNSIDRADTAGCNGKGVCEDKCYTLNTIDRHAVCFPQQAYNKFIQEDIEATLKASGGTYGGGSENLVAEQSFSPIRYIVRRLTPTECARLQGFPDWWGEIPKKDNLTDDEYVFWLNVRNTYAKINNKTTKEYSKEQMLSWYNKLHSDSSEYKMWGNGIALPNALYVMQGIAEVVGVHHSK